MKGDICAAALRLMNTLPKRTHEFKPYHRDRSKAAIAAKKAATEAQLRAREANGRKAARRRKYHDEDYGEGEE